MLLILLSLLLLSSFSSCESASSYTAHEDTVALVQLFNHTNGNYWSFKYPTSVYGSLWDVAGRSIDEIDPCREQWQGVMCTCINMSSVYCRVTNITLQSYNITGSLPSTLSSMLNLTLLDLRSNHIHGTLMSSIGKLVKLTELILSKNKLSGTLPTSLSLLSNLMKLYCDNNAYKGTVPSSLGSLSKLMYLALNYNRLSGSIPSSLASLTNLGKQIRITKLSTYFTLSFFLSTI